MLEVSESLRNYLLGTSESLDEVQIQGILKFYEMVLRENEIQNLTRLVSPKDFYFGHIQDVLELLKLDYLEYPVLDLGSGVGIPGLVGALLSEGKWILSDSEKKKAEYLERSSKILGLEKKVRVFAGRAETFLQSNQVQTIIARAVGPVERIYGWIRGCSTWNNLVLYKGPNWEEEWKSFQKSKFRDELKVLVEHNYTTGPLGEEKSRKLLKIGRI